MWRKLSRPRIVLKRRVGRALEPGFARARRPVGHDRRPGAQHVDAGILEPPDVEIAEVVMGEVVVGIAQLVIRIHQVADQVGAEPAHLASERRKVLGSGAQVVDVDIPEVDRTWACACCSSRNPFQSVFNCWPK